MAECKSSREAIEMMRIGAGGWLLRFVGLFAWLAVIGFSGASVSAQVLATWTGAGDGSSYSDPNNWSNGVVPINSGTTTYNVLVPNNHNIVFDVAGSISGISYGTGGSITLGNGVAFNVNSVASLGSNIFADGAGTSFTATGVGVSLNNSIRSIATNGAEINYSATQYIKSASGTSVAFHASGAGSTINASQLSTIENASGITFLQGHNTSFIAENGGVLDFSGVQSVVGGVSDHGWTQNLFQIQTGGNIDFSSLASLTRLNQFDVSIANYSLPSLETAEGLTLNLASESTFNTNQLLSISGAQSYLNVSSDSTWNASQLLTLNDSLIYLSSNGTINAPKVNSLANSQVNLDPTKHFNVGSIINVDNTRIGLSDGYQMQIDATSFTRSYAGSSVAFHADGIGTVLNAPAMTSIANTSGIIFNQGHNTTFSATNGGILDFSNVRTIDGGVSGHGWTQNRFLMDSNGYIDLSSVTSLQQLNQFDIEISTYALPALQTAEGWTVNLAVGTTLDTPELQTIAGWSSSIQMPIFSNWNAQNLTTLNDTILNMTIGTSLNAGSLTTFENSAVSLEPGVAFNTGLLENVNNSRFKVAGGAMLQIGAADYTRSIAGSSVAFEATGTGSKIRATDLNTINNTSGIIFNQGHTTSYIAKNSGVLDFSDVTFIDGGSSGHGWTQNLFSASSSGKIYFGDAKAQQNNTFQVDGSGAVLGFKGLELDSNSVMLATNLGRLEMSGDLSHRHTAEANFNFDNGRVWFKDVGVADLEIAGENLGVSTNGLGNFGFQQLRVGSAAGPTKLFLVDNVDNGNRTNGMREVQYLLDVSGQGLLLEYGSNLILNGNDIYISNGVDSFFSARDLFSPGQISVAYGDGFISLTSDRGEISNGDFSGSKEGGRPRGWNVTTPVTSGRIVTVSRPRPGNENNVAVQLYAGSMVELSQNVSTLFDPFYISFDAWAQDDTGTLSLLLDGNLLQSWNYSELGLDDFMSFSVLVDNPNLLGQIDMKLAFQWDATTNYSVILDDIRMTAVPEPSTLFVLLVASTVVACRRRSRATPLTQLAS